MVPGYAYFVVKWLLLKPQGEVFHALFIRNTGNISTVNKYIAIGEFPGQVFMMPVGIRYNYQFHDQSLLKKYSLTFEAFFGCIIGNNATPGKRIIAINWLQ